MAGVGAWTLYSVAASNLKVWPSRSQKRVLSWRAFVFGAVSDLRSCHRVSNAYAHRGGGSTVVETPSPSAFHSSARALLARSGVRPADVAMHGARIPENSKIPLAALRSRIRRNVSCRACHAGLPLPTSWPHPPRYAAATALSRSRIPVPGAAIDASPRRADVFARIPQMRTRTCRWMRRAPHWSHAKVPAVMGFVCARSSGRATSSSRAEYEAP
ncbi:hypothetical protein FB451DRAFT_1518484 [Mycena latifolia]|nr:hypothetical protein FB451DRAFT_1518484 [Mycena latifolia]